MRHNSDRLENHRKRATHFHDLWRNFFMGIIEGGYNSVAILVAIRHFQASDTAKSLIAGGSAVGFLLAPTILIIVGRTSVVVSQICAIFMIGTAAGLFLAANIEHVWVYTFSLVSTGILVAQVPSLMVHVYARNYSEGERGRQISGNLMISAGIGACTSLSVGQLLDQNLLLYQKVLTGMATACLFAALLHLRIPSEPLRSKRQASLFQDLKLAFVDRFFGWMLAGWMLMGVGNLITIPLRIEYVANPDFGINASNTTILVLTFILPAITRVLSAPIWAFCFDRFNLAIVRISINLCFLIGLFAYFQSTNIICLGLSSALIGWATGGGTLAWTLWVTKVAPPGRESSYMSVHSFFTGIRGVPAPFVGYWILTSLGPKQVAWVSALFIGISSLIFLRLASDSRLKSTQ